MKKFFTIMLMSMTISMLAEPSLELPKPVTVQGRFLEMTNVCYEIYELCEDSTYAFIGEGVGKKTFNFQVFAGSTYIVKFTGADTLVKYLFIKADQRGTFTVDVDFSRTGSAEMYWTGTEYAIKPLNTESLCLPDEGGVTSR